MIMRKSDVEFHSSEPAVNVKVYKSIRNVTLPMELGRFSNGTEYTDSNFTHDWIEDYLEREDRDWATTFEMVCADGFEMLEDEAQDIFGSHVKVYSEGRSGGWAVVHGLKDFDSWDAIDLAKWAKFTKFARAITDDVPRQMVHSIYLDAYEPAMIEPLTGVAL